MRTPSTTRAIAAVKSRHRSDVTGLDLKRRSVLIGTAMPYLLVCIVGVVMSRLPSGAALR